MTFGTDTNPLDVNFGNNFNSLGLRWCCHDREATCVAFSCSWDTRKLHGSN